MRVHFKKHIVITKPNYLIVCCLLLTACAQTTSRTETAQPVAPAEPQAETGPVLPDLELNDELLYEFLLTEIANQRGHKALAVKSSADIAKKTGDPRLAKRAAQLAVESGDMSKSIDALRYWREVEPTSIFAARMLSSIWLRGGKLDEAQPELAMILATEKENQGNEFMQIFQMVVSHPDKSV